MLEQQLLLSPVAQQVDRAHLAGLTSAATTMEFLAAAHDGIRRDSQPMRLQTGLVEQRYAIKQLLSSGVSYKVRSRPLRTGDALLFHPTMAAPILRRVHR